MTNGPESYDDDSDPEAREIDYPDEDEYTNQIMGSIYDLDDYEDEYENEEEKSQSSDEDAMDLDDYEQELENELENEHRMSLYEYMYGQGFQGPDFEDPLDWNVDGMRDESAIDWYGESLRDRYETQNHWTEEDLDAMRDEYANNYMNNLFDKNSDSCLETTKNQNCAPFG